MDTSNIQPIFGQPFSFIEAFSVLYHLSNQPEFMGHSARPIAPETILPRRPENSRNINPLSDASIRSPEALRIGLADASNRAGNIELTDEILEQSQKDWQPILTQIKERALSVNAALPGAEKTLLHEAAHQGKLDIVKQLMDLGADQNARTCMGFNTLHWATIGGHIDVAQYLVDEKGFDLTESTNSEGQDALKISDSLLSRENDPLKKESYKNLSSWLKTRKSSITSGSKGLR